MMYPCGEKRNTPEGKAKIQTWKDVARGAGMSILGAGLMTAGHAIGGDDGFGFFTMGAMATIAGTAMVGARVLHHSPKLRKSLMAAKKKLDNFFEAAIDEELSAEQKQLAQKIKKFDDVEFTVREGYEDPQTGKLMFKYRNLNQGR